MTLAYVIDSQFQVLFSSTELNHPAPNSGTGQRCYEVFGNEHAQCKKCPLRSEHAGTSTHFDHVRCEWIKMYSAPIHVPGSGACHVIIREYSEDSGNHFLYDTAGKSDYAELMALNYRENSFRVVYHGERQNPNSPMSGRLTDVVYRVADNVIHPDDRERFLNFWLLDQIGAEQVPAQLFTTRHGEFRRLRQDGSYEWSQQVMLPIRKSSKYEIFVNNFFNIIEMPTFQAFAPDQDSPIFSRDTFFSKAGELLAQAAPDTQWSMIAIDVEGLKLFNEWYGRKAGDELLERISYCLRIFQNSRDRIAGYFYDDDFAFLMPTDPALTDRLCQTVITQIKQSSDKMNILPAFGIYTHTGSSESVLSMYDRAKLACASIKGNYAQRIKHFDAQMLDTLQAEYLLLSDVQKAFQNREFTFYLQPKCGTENGKIAGAEALARWCNPEKGMVSPGIFVPFLEKSGLISELDTYIWEEACKWQRSMLDRGLATVPVSVNVSKIDMYAVDVATCFCDLIKKYRLDPSLIEIEITESAYAEDMDNMIQVVRSLRNAGFCVLMDDFGSAYSSLNMLKDIEVDILKMDMRFLEAGRSNAGRAANIVETVCHMARILGLNMVAEGVENQSQQEMLLMAGCTFSQGYYFYRPLSVQDFEQTISDPDNLYRAEKTPQQDALFHLKDLMLQNIFNLNMLDNLVGAMAFYDVCGDQISIIRFNEQYAALLGSDTASTEMALCFGQQLYKEEYQKVFATFDRARKNTAAGSEMDLRRRRPDGTDIWVNLRMFFLYQRNGHDIFYSTLRDVTRIHRNNKSLDTPDGAIPGV